MDAKADRSIEVLGRETLSKRFITLEKVTIEHATRSGGRITVEREIHDHGNAATILLYDPARKSVALVRQLRVPVYLNGGEGWMIETPAGLLDGEHPAEAIAREAMEETGYRVENAEHLFDAYMSPGTVTERVSFFAAEIDLAKKAGKGGGLASEGEDIEVLDLTLDAAFSMIATGEICDGKTIMMLQWARMRYGP
ncbi:MAG: NUDIX domain-containing protein [Rhizobium sp.]|nr:NUDIX domain-containing protein [Rhizobium sp.]